ncbi:MAG: HAD superfamily hydrolase (TIGR01509 family) [Saprospiraceae bacterium]
MISAANCTYTWVRLLPLAFFIKSSKELKSYLLPSPKIKALIFDLDGTLADTMPLHLESWQEVGRQFGVPIKDHMINDLAGTPTIEVMKLLNERYGWSADPIKVYKAKNESYVQLKKIAGKTKPIPEVLAVAEHYKGLMPIAIGTGSSRIDAEEAIKDLGILSWFEVLITADEVIQGKPHPETYLKCARALNMPPEDCLVYEDGPMGIVSALNAKMTAVNIVTGETHSP